MSRLSLSYLFLSSAQSCTTAPSCSELGYTKSASDCAGKTILYCPFDRTKAYCVDEITCASLGFTDTISECPGEYTLCPSDSSKGKCIFEARPGDLKYSLRTADHNGWLLCNGRAYSSSQYPELYEALKDSFGSKLPNYTGYFLKAAATSSASAFKTPQAAGLPDIVGQFGPVNDNSVEHKNGAFITAGAWSRSVNGGNTGGTTLEFRASKSNSIYGKSSTVTPQNYSANVFIYAGKSQGADDTLVQCDVGMYLNADGTCSQTLIVAKNPLGVIAQDWSTQWVIIWGGTASATETAGREECYEASNYQGMFALETDLNSVRGKFAASSGHPRAVAAVQPYTYYWTNFSNAHNYYYMYCNSTTCTPYSSVPSGTPSYYYYCRMFVDK